MCRLQARISCFQPSKLPPHPGKKTSQLKIFFTSTRGGNERPERRDFITIDTAIPFQATFTYRLTKTFAGPGLTTVHTTYSDIMSHLRYESNGIVNSFAPGFALIGQLGILSFRARNIFGSLDNINLFT